MVVDRKKSQLISLETGKGGAKRWDGVINTADKPGKQSGGESYRKKHSMRHALQLMGRGARSL